MRLSQPCNVEKDHNRIRPRFAETPRQLTDEPVEVLIVADRDLKGHVTWKACNDLPNAIKPTSPLQATVPRTSRHAAAPLSTRITLMNSRTVAHEFAVRVGERISSPAVSARALRRVSTRIGRPPRMCACDSGQATTLATKPA